MKSERSKTFEFDKVILLIRDPFEALQSEFNRRKSGEDHIGFASAEAYREKWKLFVKIWSAKWFYFHTYWYNKVVKPQNIHVIIYESLVQDTKNELRKVLKFLDINITKADMKCTMNHKEGLYLT